ncbi:MAG: DsbA family protein [bacterium]|nr:DsbA family protein [bacterium]
MDKQLKTKSLAEAMSQKPSMERHSNMSQQPYSLTNMLNFVSSNFAIFFIVGLFFLGGFLGGSLWTENKMLKNGGGVAQAPVAAGAGVGADAGAPAGPTAEQLKQMPAVTGDDYFRGGENAKITLVEYSDYECPFCARFHPTMNQIMAEYGDQVKWVYRHYPLSFHPNAQKAAEAAECVGKLGGNDAFWVYGDTIFEENTKAGGQISPTVIESSVQAAGVNMQQFKTCLDSGEMAQKVTDAMAGGSAAGVTGTPGTVLVTEGGDYELINGALPYESVKATIDSYL